MEKIYCSYCGKENERNKKVCKKCFKLLEPKDHLLIDYMKSKWFGECKDGVFKAIKNFIQTHLYGFIMTCSILVASVTVFVNVVNKNATYQIVSEKPTMVLSYAGEGLNSEEVVKKYIEAVKKDDSSTIKKLRLETFHPEIRSEIEKNGYDLPNTYFDPILKYEYSKNGIYYYKEIHEESKISKAIPAYGYAENYYINQYGRYKTYTYEQTLQYCSYNDCKRAEVEEVIAGVPFITIWIQIVEVDGKYYVLGEQAVGKTIYEFLVNKLLIEHEGNTKNFSFTEIDKAMITCSDEEDCLKILGIEE